MFSISSILSSNPPILFFSLLMSSSLSYSLARVGLSTFKIELQSSTTFV
nr:MAG TPA: hypothetical protein [Bacteriophage sp.]